LATNCQHGFVNAAPLHKGYQPELTVVALQHWP
jgi:hypothetical protein